MSKRVIETGQIPARCSKGHEHVITKLTTQIHTAPISDGTEWINSGRKWKLGDGRALQTDDEFTFRDETGETFIKV